MMFWGLITNSKARKSCYHEITNLSVEYKRGLQKLHLPKWDQKSTLPRILLPTSNNSGHLEKKHLYLVIITMMLIYTVWKKTLLTCFMLCSCTVTQQKSEQVVLHSSIFPCSKTPLGQSPLPHITWFLRLPLQYLQMPLTLLPSLKAKSILLQSILVTPLKMQLLL